MPELAARLLTERGATAHPAPLSRLLIQRGFTAKKTLLASKTDRAEHCTTTADMLQIECSILQVSLP